MRATVGVLPLLLLIVGCQRPAWTGWIYPDRNNLAHSIEIGPYKSADACRAAILRATREMVDPEGWDYECGLGCKRAEGGVKICTATAR